MFAGLYPAGIWAVDFEYSFAPSGQLLPLCLVAKELKTGRLIRQWKPFGPEPPYPTRPDALFVSYSAQAEVSCHLALDWPVPARILDLCAEYSDITSGLRKDTETRRLTDALKHYGLDHIDAHEKKAMQQRALQGDPLSEQEIVEMLDYCQTDVDALERLLPKMLPSITLRWALLRGRHMAGIARMERAGVPLDKRLLERLWTNEDEIKAGLIEKINAVYGCYDNKGHLKLAKFWDYCRSHGISWPATPTGRPGLKEEVRDEQALIHPEMKLFCDTFRIIQSMKLIEVRLDGDGRNRVGLRAFATKTGRCAPSSKEFIFGPGRWLRHFIVPDAGNALAYIDLEQAEFGIAAALSGDPAMMEAYLSADCYLTFARQAGEDVPIGATEKSHPHLNSLKEIRATYKIVVLATQYGQTCWGIAKRLKIAPEAAQDLLDAHRRTYRVFWEWIEDEVDNARLRHQMMTCFGWHVHVTPDTKDRTLLNFPMQAGCGEIFRTLSTEAGIEVCAPVHDAVLIRAPLDRIEEDVAKVCAFAAEASRVVLGGFELRTDVKIIAPAADCKPEPNWHPDRFPEPRGEEMWRLVMELLETAECRRLAAE
jgi:DNA polymerase-1